MFGFKAKREAAIAAACAAGVHVRDSAAVSHEGGKLTAPCQHCGTTLTRTASGWRIAPSATFFSTTLSPTA